MTAESLFPAMRCTSESCMGQVKTHRAMGRKIHDSSSPTYYVCTACGDEKVIEPKPKSRANVDASIDPIPQNTTVASANVLSRVQTELAPWERHNFGDRPAWQPLLGMGEELGELNHAFLKKAQGIRGTPEEHIADMKDAIGDIMIFMLDFCNAMGFDANQILLDTWSTVSKRDFKRFPKNGLTE